MNERVVISEVHVMREYPDVPFYPNVDRRFYTKPDPFYHSPIAEVGRRSKTA